MPHRRVAPAETPQTNRSKILNTTARLNRLFLVSLVWWGWLFVSHGTTKLEDSAEEHVSLARDFNPMSLARTSFPITHKSSPHSTAHLFTIQHIVQGHTYQQENALSSAQQGLSFRQTTAIEKWENQFEKIPSDNQKQKWPDTTIPDSSILRTDWSAFEHMIRTSNLFDSLPFSYDTRRIAGKPHIFGRETCKRGQNPMRSRPHKAHSK